MGLGFGVMKQMNDTFKQNKALLGKKKSAYENYKQEVKKRETSLENQDLELVSSRVKEALKTNPAAERFAKIVIVITLVAICAALIWAFTKINFTWKESKYPDKRALFQTIHYVQGDGLTLKTDYYHKGPRASETLVKNGLKHQNSESYYESGEQFRSALYYYDTLITDIYFFKSGDTIRNFPAKYDQSVYHIKLVDKKRKRLVNFDYYDGKVI